MKTFIIAEAGVNHNGDFEIAKKLVDAAKDAGADAVKFQTFSTDALVTADAKKATYQIVNTGIIESQAEMLRELEFSPEVYEKLIVYCKERGIMFMSTPFDLESISLLESFGMEIWKIPSGEITNLPYLRRIGSLRKRIILSTGMATLEEVGEALKVLFEAGTSKDRITVLHCHTHHPTRPEDVNLRAMCTIRNEFGVRIGYSDHTLGIEVPTAAVALGAQVIEKHLTLDRSMPGPDHVASLEAGEFNKMVIAIRNIEQALGNGIKTPTMRESEIITVARKSIVAARDIAAGETLSEENITTKRPGGGLSPMLWFNVIGRVATRDFRVDEYIIL